MSQMAIDSYQRRGRSEWAELTMTITRRRVLQSPVSFPLNYNRYLAGQLGRLALSFAGAHVSDFSLQNRRNGTMATKARAPHPMHTVNQSETGTRAAFDQANRAAHEAFNRVK